MPKRQHHRGKESLHGLEELNLVEFPLGLLSDKRPEGIKTLIFADSIYDQQSRERIRRTVTITGAAAWGLPNCTDIDVLLALMKLTNDRHGFRERRIEFSLYELRHLLGWGPSTNYTRMLKESLMRLLGVTVAYENAWWGNGRWASLEGFHLIDNVALTNTQEHFSDEEQHLKWNDVIVESVRAQRTKGLDWPFYMSLKSAVSKRLYRLLDKRFGLQRRPWTFDVETFCHHKLGVSSRTEVYDCKQMLKRAMKELAGRGFLLPPDRTTFVKVRKGVHEVIFRPAGKAYAVRKKDTLVVPEKRDCDDALVTALLERRVHNAVQLVAKYPAERIRLQLENFDDRQRQGEKLQPGWLRKAIEEDYSFRSGYRPQQEVLAERSRAVEQKKARAAMVAKRQQQEQAKQDRIEASLDAFLAGLPNDAARRAFEEEALQSESWFRKNLKRKEGMNAETVAIYRRTALLRHFKRQQGDQEGSR